MCMKLIEIVCTANEGRSPLGEIFAQKEIERLGLWTEYKAISTGTLVDEIAAGNVPIKAMVPIIDTARKRDGFYSAADLKKLDKALRDGDTDTVKRYFKMAEDVFGKEGIADRTLILKKMGIEGAVKAYRTQTVVNPDVVAVLPVDASNLKRVNGIYQPVEESKRPLIECLDAGSAFGHGTAVYRDVIGKLAQKVPEVVGRVVVA